MHSAVQLSVQKIQLLVHLNFSTEDAAGDVSHCVGSLAYIENLFSVIAMNVTEVYVLSALCYCMHYPQLIARGAELSSQEPQATRSAFIRL